MAASKYMETAAQPALREPRPRTPSSSSDVAVGLLLLLTVAGAAVQAIALTGPARLVMLAATGLGLLIGVWRPSVWITIPVIVVIGVVAVVAAYALDTDDTSLIWLIIGGAIVAALGCGAVWVSSLLRRVYRRMRENRRAIEALTQIDPTTGVFKPHAGRDRLRAEVTRAVRYHRPFTLLVGKAKGWEMEVERRGITTAQEVFAETLRTATTVLRNNDIIASEPDYSFIVILPETTAEGGEIAAQHIQEAVQGLLEVQFGLVQCPDDGETVEALLREANQALSFAEMTSLPLVSRRALIAE
ncbi:MAG: diguanylate cyclase [Chloroflexota bacterium]|nr:diguanylate cyclase [Chloroflexota bacterium]MDQ6906989.1 diguanylate cyclase [Chloroflexota bacterium]